VLGELEDRVCSYLQKGTDAEAEVLGSVAAVLPEPFKDALPEPLKDALRPRPAGAGATSVNGNGSAAAAGLASWTIASDDEVAVAVAVEEDDLPPMTPAAIAASQTGARLLTLSRMHCTRCCAAPCCPACDNGRCPQPSAGG
jgi:hypothetical protein